MSVSSTVYVILRYLLAFALLAMSFLYLAEVYGAEVHRALGEPLGTGAVFGFPASARFAVVNGKKIDKFVAGAALVGISVKHFFMLIGACKLAAAIAFFTGALEYLATVLLAVLLLCVVWGHLQIDGDIASPAILAGLVAVKLLLHPSATGTKAAKTE